MPNIPYQPTHRPQPNSLKLCKLSTQILCLRLGSKSTKETEDSPRRIKKKLQSAKIGIVLEYSTLTGRTKLYHYAHPNLNPASV